MKLFFIAVIGLFITNCTILAQTSGLSEIKKFDLSRLWVTNGLTDIDDPNLFALRRPDPLGFIGDNYQRINIRIQEVIKDEQDPLVYYVRGTSEVKGNICSFLGTIEVVSSELTLRGEYLDGEEYNVDMETVKKRGAIMCNYVFYENRNQKWTGYFYGELQTKVYLTVANEIKYDAIKGFSDAYMNNSFEGHWKSYLSGKSKICNWGEFRIPNSGDLNIGAGSFSPNPKYIDNGWRD